LRLGKGYETRSASGNIRDVAPDDFARQDSVSALLGRAEHHTVVSGTASLLALRTANSKIATTTMTRFRAASMQQAISCFLKQL
jgi:hypothetical protein